MLMMAHQTRLHPDPSGHRLFITDNYYTRLTLANNLKKETEGEACLLGTMKYTNMKKHDKETLEKASTVLKNKPRGSWVLCQVREPKKPTRPSGSGGAGVLNTTLPEVIGRGFIDLEEIKIYAMTCVELRSRLKSRNLKVS